MARKLIFIFLGMFALSMCLISIIIGSFFNVMLLPGGILFLVLGFKARTLKQSKKLKWQLYKLKLYMQGKSDTYIKQRTAKSSFFIASQRNNGL